MVDCGVYDESLDKPVWYDRLIEGELYAMTVASLMYAPWLNQRDD